MTDETEGNLNLIQLQGMVEIDTIKVANIFIKSGKRRLMHHDLSPSKFLAFHQEIVNRFVHKVINLVSRVI